ncbi:MAG: hypothetical protein ABR928_05275 [Terracidiphilus sp.]|jgi:hypothetical protein
MERMLATPADAEIVLKLYQLRTEATMRQARAWVLGEFWPKTADEFFAVLDNPGDKHNPWLRQVVTYWEMAAAMVLHGAVSAELFVDCNAEGFSILAKFAPILPAIREKYPTYLTKTSDMVKRFSSAAQRYEGIERRVEVTRAAHAARQKKRSAKGAGDRVEAVADISGELPLEAPEAPAS